MKIAYVRPYVGEEAIVTATLAPEDCVFTDDIAALDEATRQEITILSVFVDYQITKTTLALLPQLQCIATRSAGVDHLDLTAAKERGITISRVPHYGTRTVAEYAFAMMFALSRNVFRSYIDMQRVTKMPDLSIYEGFDLCGKTLGVIGTGAIGRSVCTIGSGIGMQVLAYDVHRDVALAADPNIRYVSLEELLAQSDIVTLHVPSIPATHHLLDEQKIAHMKPGSYLINTARGDVVETKALVAALKTGHLKGAALDVLEGEHDLQDEVELLTATGASSTDWETLIADHTLIDMPNVIVTPHIAFNTTEAKREITDITLANIQAFAANAPQNTVAYE